MDQGMNAIVRGNRIVYTNPPVGDLTWATADKERAKTIEARWIATGVPHSEREQLLPCYIWKKKLPGLHYTDAIEARLQALEAKS